MSTKQTSRHIKLDERHHVEEPFPDQLAGLGSHFIGSAEKPRRVGKPRMSA